MAVMLRMLGGGSRSVEIFAAASDKTIKTVELVDDALRFEMADGSKFQLRDEGQSCCEHRYMRTDDDLSYYVGSRLTGAEMRDAPSVQDDDAECHDVQFLAIFTSRGEFVLSSHVEHNGYYGGFAIEASEWS